MSRRLAGEESTGSTATVRAAGARGPVHRPWVAYVRDRDAVAAVLHTIEGISERLVFDAYELGAEDIQAVLDETGTPAGWFPLIEGYDRLPELPAGLPSIPAEVLDAFNACPRHKLSDDRLKSLRQRLRALYEAGPGARAEEASEEEEATGVEDEDQEEDTVAPGARIPIPAESLLEELSLKLEVHPISVFWLLTELRERDGVTCEAELRSYVENYLSVLALKLLGHRWPREIEAEPASSGNGDQRAIIPITPSPGARSLLELVRERLVADWGEQRQYGVEQELAAILGEPLERWLASGFFRRHVAQFRKRPIAWQLASRPLTATATGGTKRRRAGARSPAFSCLIYYHGLSADLLPELKTQYVGPLRMGFEAELRTLEAAEKRTGD